MVWGLRFYAGHSVLRQCRSDQPVTIKAQSVVNPSVSAAEKLILKAGTLVLSPAKSTIDRGLSQQLKATFGSTAYSNLEWSISPQVGSIARNGIYTAPESLPQDTNVTVTARSKDNPAESATAVVKVKAKPDTIRINCGDGAGFTDSHNNVWSGDYGFTPGTQAYSNAVPIAGAPTDLQHLYHSSRYVYAGQEFSYDFSVPNGRYAVTLMFADYTYDAAGHYSFDVKLNGVKVLSKFDPDAAHGSKTAVNQTFETTIKNKQLHINFLAYVGAAFINGIQIVYIGPS